MDEGNKQRRQRRAFTDEFKAEVVRLILDEGKSVIAGGSRSRPAPELAARVGEACRADRTKGKTGLTTEGREELSQLQREVRTLTRCAAVSCILRALQEGQTARFLHENVTRNSCLHPPHRDPCAACPPAAARCSKQAVWQLRVDRRVLIGQGSAA
jgi:transposase